MSEETKQPLEDVVVLAWWTKHVGSFGGPSAEYHDSQEVLTDKDGRFTIASRSFFSLNPLVFFRGPFFAFFKSGYGEAQWPGYKGSEFRTWSKEKQKAFGTAAKLLQLDGIVLEMPRLQSIEERRERLKKLDYWPVPPEERPLLENAIVDERGALGYRSNSHPSPGSRLPLLLSPSLLLQRAKAWGEIKVPGTFTPSRRR